ncbi:serine/threonine protein kinase [Roseiflexus sp.]|uniref:serine/threonine protein kinase n=1 Tax=Roseiflexus sp. TaxID=2562120 RepID=UPI00398ACE7C
MSELSKLPFRLGSFEVLEQIGFGLSGNVYKARYRDGTMVALKVLSHKSAKDPTVLGYFTNEQLLLREIKEHRRHPHIVEYFSSNFNTPPFYLATRLVEGARSLETIIGGGPFGGRPQPAAFVVRVVSQIASALDYLHTGHPTFCPIVHRDVKPANILIDAAGNAVLIDFSIASHPYYARVDEKNLGTPGYMAPEQYTGEEKPASDQFALALVTLYMFTGRHPLPERATTSHKQIERWRDSKYEDIVRMLEHRVHTADVLIRALAYRSEDRYRSCEEFADRLRRALAQDGEQVYEPTPVPLVAGIQPSSSQPKQLAVWIGISFVAFIAIAVLILAVTLV